jgi:predicted ATPase/DNA-binding SARP family transcriptional activator
MIDLRGPFWKAPAAWRSRTDTCFARSPPLLVSGQNGRVQVAMLGPLEVRDSTGSPREVSGTRLRALLILLALRAGQVVPASALIDELWGERLPADAPNALQALVSRLRRAIGEAAAVVSGPAGYQLRISRDDVDAFRFERLAARGRAALAASPDEAAGLLAQALSLWRGEPLPDAAETETGRAAIARLTELRLTAAEDRADAALRLSELRPGHARQGDAGPEEHGRGEFGRRERASELVAELEGLLTASPARETLAALLMRALAADGRRGAALQVYERTRERLADELGADPSPQLAALHLQLLRADGRGPSLSPAAAAMTVPVTAPLPPGASQPTPGARHDGTAAPHGNLPAALTSFLGRESDLGGVSALLREYRLVTLTGPGGAGKTRLAIEAARSMTPASGAWLAELAPVTDPADVAVTVLSAFRLREQALMITRQARARDVAAGTVATVNAGADEDVIERLVGALAGRQALLVLDNCEHLIAASADLADRVLARCPGMRVLATSREPLNITGEALWPVGPLAESPAIRLFTERAAAVSPGFRLTAANSPAVSRICQALDGLPLAIELAAARARAMTPAQIADRLDQRFRLLTGGSRTALPRHQTLRAVVDWSWDLLGDSERALLRRLSAFTGGATLEAAEQVCAVPPVATGDVLDLLIALADKSLLIVRQAGDGPRYQMLETIREYGRERLAEAGETEPLRRGHAAYFLRFAEEAQPHLFGADQLDWLRRMSADADNVHLAIRGAVAAGDRVTAVSLVAGFAWFWWLRSMKREAGDLAALALSGAPTAAQAIAAQVAEARADEARGDEARGDSDQAWLERLATAYGMSGMLVLDSARFDQSVVWLREAEDLARRLGPQPGSTFAVRAVVALAGPLRMMAETHGRMEHAYLDAAVTDPDPWVSGLGRVLRGQIRLNQGRMADQAEADFRAAVSAFEQLGERWGLAMGVSGLAQVEEWRNELAVAAAHYGRAADLAGELGTTEDETQFRMYLARVLWHLGGADRDQSRAEVTRALRDADRLGWPESTAYAHYVAGNLARLDGDLATAREQLDLAVRVTEAYGAGLGQISAVTCTARGYLAAAEGDLAAARSWQQRALAAALPTGDAPVIAEVLTGMADVALRRGDAARAATLLGAAEGVRGIRNRSDEDGARVTAAACALLSPADYSAALERGRAVSLPTLEAALRAFLAPGA